MHDLTQGSILKHLLKLTSFMFVTMLFQTLYFVADLYWVGRLGKESIAAVGLAGNLMFLVLAVTQTLSVGITTLVSHATGRKDSAQVQLFFNQGLALATVVGVIFCAAAFLLRTAYCNWLGADANTARQGEQYLRWFIPALFLQFPMAAAGAALRGTGHLRPTMILQVSTIALNIVLAPVLIFGWITHHPMGVAGAAVATLISIAAGMAGLIVYFLNEATFLEFHPAEWKPRLEIWKRMAGIGLPAGAEFALMTVYMVLVYYIIRTFGASAQAGFGIGMRIMQSFFLPGMAVSFALAPLAGQNFGARKGDRVRESFRVAATISVTMMVLFTILCHIAPEALVRFFSHDAGVIAFGSQYLRIISYNFIASGLVFCISSMFQGIGNTLPALASSSLRLVLFALPAFLIARTPGFDIRQIWLLSVVSVTAQMVLSYFLLQREFRRKLNFEPAPQAQAVTV